MNVNLSRLLLAYLFLQSCQVYSQSEVSEPYQSLREGITWQNENNVRQHVYLHIDKDIFNAGEQLWYKAYVFCDKNILDTISKNLYVELWSPSGKRAAISRLKLSNGLAHGSLFFSDTLEQGIYQLRAYTDLMLNFGSGFYYNKNIVFHNSNHSNLISKSEARKNRKALEEIARIRKKNQISLFAEGGTLIEGQSHKIYYKSTNKFGELVEVKISPNIANAGIITDEENKYAGLGYFYIKPEANTKYELSFLDRNGKTVKCKLPPVSSSGVTGIVSQSSDSVKLYLKKTNVSSNDPSANRYYVLAYTGNKYVYSSIVDLRNDTLLALPKQTLPPGIVSFSVLTYRLSPAAHFRIFIQPNLVEKPQVAYSKTNDSISIKIINSKTDRLKYASVSLTLEANHEYEIDEYFAIQSYLDSDLNGTYLDKLDTSIFSNEKWIECLINTCDFILPEWSTIAGEMQKVSRPVPESGIELSGRILSDVFTVPVKNHEVKLEVMENYNDIYTTRTNDQGQFRFAGFDFYDTLRMRLICSSTQSKKVGSIEFETEQPKEVSEYYGDFFLTTRSTRNNKQYRKTMSANAKEDYMKQQKELDKLYSGKTYGRPDYILYRKDLPQHMSVLNAIKGRVPGVSVTGDDIQIRGSQSLYSSTQPLVFVDDIQTEVNYLGEMSAHEVDRIEFLKGSSAASYGSRGGNGVILVYTLRGEFALRGVLDFTLYGYHKPKKFDTVILKDSSLVVKMPATLWWNPNLNTEKTNFDEIKIKNPDSNYPLKIKIEGITESGKPISMVSWIE